MHARFGCSNWRMPTVRFVLDEGLVAATRRMSALETLSISVQLLEELAPVAVAADR